MYQRHALRFRFWVTFYGLEWQLHPAGVVRQFVGVVDSPGARAVTDASDTRLGFARGDPPPIAYRLSPSGLLS